VITTTPAVPVAAKERLEVVDVHLGVPFGRRGASVDGDARPYRGVGRLVRSDGKVHGALRYGLGLYGKLGPAVGVGLSLLIFTLQGPLSLWWLRHFRFGPVEWVWRSLTYGRFQPFRIT
jgi:hypothetical protein